jgi:hypothetical protein
MLDRRAGLSVKPSLHGLVLSARGLAFIPSARFVRSSFFSIPLRSQLLESGADRSHTARDYRRFSCFHCPAFEFDRALEDDLFFDFDDILDFLDLLGLTPARFEDDLDLARLAVFFMMISPGTDPGLVRLLILRFDKHTDLDCAQRRCLPGARSRQKLLRDSA